MSPRNTAFRIALSALALSLCAGPAVAGPLDPRALPPGLAPWVPWVLDEVPEHACPVVAGAAACLWPGELVLSVEADGAAFSQDAHVDMAMFLELPGDPTLWPQGVTVDGKPAAVLAREGRPAVMLAPGEHRVAGRLPWAKRPEGIRIPAATARIGLTVDRVPMPFPRRDADGLLWLQNAARAGQEGERLDLEVSRKVADGIPLLVTTRIVLRAAGKAREQNLGRVLLEGTIPMSLTANVPARLDKEGALRVQVRAGTHSIEILARTDGSPETLVAPRKDPPWPAEETWVFEANEVFRQAALSGPPGVDPSRTGISEEWRKLPAFLLSGGAKLTVATTRRGEPDPPPDKLELRREMWMDLSGKGFTVRDNLSGSLSRASRLDLGKPGALGHVSVDGADQLITRNPSSGLAGVELRRGAVAMQAEWRVEGRARDVPAVAWSQDVQSLSATLHLPPGWTLLTASGVDELPGTWVAEWTLFSFFFVLLLSLAVGKLAGWPWGALTLVMLALCHNEDGAPFYEWLSLLAAMGLLRVLPEGRIKLANRAWWWLSAIALAVAVVPFSVGQVRTGLFPQIEESGDAFGFGPMGMAERAASAPPLEPMPVQAPAKGKEQKAAESESDGRMAQQAAQSLDVGVISTRPGSGWGRGEGRLGGKMRYQTALQQDPKAVVQTGPGVPRWTWHRWNLNWSGPVTKDHEIGLWLLSPRVNLILSLLRVLLVLALAYRLVRGSWSNVKLVSAPVAGAAAVTTGLALLLSPWSAFSTEAPEQTVLQDLKARLTRPAECRPDCVSIPALDIEVKGASLRLVAEAHAGEASSFRLPGPAQNWVPATVKVDGRRATALALREDGFIHVRLDAGRHVVEAVGPMPPSDTVTLQFGDAPHRVTATAPGFTIDGLREDGRAESSIQITRAVEAGAVRVAEEGSYPPWLEITRTLDIGIPWLVHTAVRRVSPTGSPVLVRVPLLPGESVTESELEVEGREVVLSMGRDDEEVRWSSTLEERPSFELDAPAGKPWSEVWILKCSPVWQCAFKGLTPVRHQIEGRFEPELRPWPGESLSLAFRRPEGMAGRSVTIDSAELRAWPGVRLQKAHLALQVRSSRGGVQKIALPPGARVQDLSVGGAKLPLRQSGNTIEITLKPGTQAIDVDWQQPGGISARQKAPAVSLNGEAVNARVTIVLPEDRWLLFAGGPSWGPAVLFWGYLVVVLLAAFVLGRIPTSPLKTWQWVLLGAGLTQIPAPAAIVIVGWFFALTWRRRRPLQHFVVHNGLQVVLALWTLVALGCLYGAVHMGLLVQPDMQVAGGGSTNTELSWYVDRMALGLPEPWVLSLPLWVFRVAMLLWALWMAASLVKWMVWAWRCVSHELLWRPRPPRPTRDETKSGA
ncbi:MAG: hypothetical protein PHU25_03530 [Deltaproteobacteria bacterium]|nr:hypothetical protein [Deltaproteobacteria bacterium]